MSRRARVALAAAAGLVLGASAPAEEDGLRPATLLEVRPESGLVERAAEPALDGGETLAVRRATTRLVVRGSDGARARLRFAYLGPSADQAPLASGELRRQVGLKLRAQDTCNVLYVMWHLEPRPRLVVELKSNPGAHQHSACGAGGYRQVEGTLLRPVPPVRPGEPHLLEGRLEGERLTVLVDGERAWEGRVGPADAAEPGLTGVRTDNGAFDLQLWVRPGSPR